MTNQHEMQLSLDLMQSTIDQNQEGQLPEKSVSNVSEKKNTTLT